MSVVGWVSLRLRLRLGLGLRLLLLGVSGWLLVGGVMRTIRVGPDKKATLVDAKDATIVDESVEHLCERTRG